MTPELQSCSPVDGVSYSRAAKDGLSLESELYLPFDVVQHFSCWMSSTRKKAEVQGILGLQAVGGRQKDVIYCS